MVRRSGSLFVVAIAIALGSCGDETPESASASTASPNGAGLSGIEWLLQEVVEGDAPAPPPLDGVVVRFDGMGGWSKDGGCNDFHGSATITGAVIRFDEGRYSTDQACFGPADDVDDLIDATFKGEVGWAVESGLLRLTTASGTTLVFAVREMIWPDTDTDAVALAEGQIAGGDWRLAVAPSLLPHDNLPLVFEWRGGPGQQWNQAGGGGDASDATSLSMATGVQGPGGNVFVFGATSLATARVVIEIDSEPVDLPVYAAPGYEGLVAYGGFVDGGDEPSTVVVVAYDSGGTELGRRELFGRPWRQ